MRRDRKLILKICRKILLSYSIDIKSGSTQNVVNIVRSRFGIKGNRWEILCKFASRIRDHGLDPKSLKRKRNTISYSDAKKRATPMWADVNEISIFYEEAHSKGLEVDHIIPLRHNKVCGLHCKDNLQMLSSDLNQWKSNKLLYDRSNKT